MKTEGRRWEGDVKMGGDARKKMKMEERIDGKNRREGYYFHTFANNTTKDILVHHLRFSPNLITHIIRTQLREATSCASKPLGITDLHLLVLVAFPIHAFPLPLVGTPICLANGLSLGVSAVLGSHIVH
jgi:hypothetical protein